MFKRISQVVALFSATLVLGMHTGPIDYAEEPIIAETTAVKMEEYKSTPAKMVEVKTLLKSSGMIVEPKISKEDKELIALITMAEAEGESEKGKRLVIDTILNRMDSEHFPDTIREVIYQPSQFTSVWNGRVDRCYVMNDIYQLVEEEIESRLNSETVYFTAGEYGKYGKPLFQEGNHYFASYD